MPSTVTIVRLQNPKQQITNPNIANNNHLQFPVHALQQLQPAKMPRLPSALPHMPKKPQSIVISLTYPGRKVKHKIVSIGSQDIDKYEVCDSWYSKLDYQDWGTY